MASALASLAILARLHHVACEPEALRHQLGLGASEEAGPEQLLIAAKTLGLQAKQVRSSLQRLSLVPLPALAFANDGRTLVLAQCDGQRVLYLDPSDVEMGSHAELLTHPRGSYARLWRLQGDGVLEEESLK